jgi:predicted phage terminase large subunit-like protein
VKEADAPKDSKTARANAVSPIVEAGRVFVPEGVPWVDAFFAQIAAFPNAAHDDMVDCLVGMIQSEQTTGVRVHSTAR